jgi:5,10-methylene-tetrahydrofolate dehydrogenase/methenyl tetrahydrofolate cyclohydrolase
MLDRYTASVGRDPAIAYDGLDLVLVGRSNNVGKPAAILGLQRNATVISAHRHTFDAGRLAGGVGPITDIWVLRNTVSAAWLQMSPPERHAVTFAGS